MANYQFFSRISLKHTQMRNISKRICDLSYQCLDRKPNYDDQKKTCSSKRVPLTPGKLWCFRAIPVDWPIYTQFQIIIVMAVTRSQILRKPFVLHSSRMRMIHRGEPLLFAIPFEYIMNPSTFTFRITIGLEQYSSMARIPAYRIPFLFVCCYWGSIVSMLQCDYRCSFFLRAIGFASCRRGWSLSHRIRICTRVRWLVVWPLQPKLNTITHTKSNEGSGKIETFVFHFLY